MAAKTEDINGALLASLKDDMKALHGGMTTLANTVTGLEQKLMTNLRKIIQEETKKFGDA